MGNIFPKIWDILKRSIFYRRPNHRSQPDHPEENFPGNIRIVNSSIEVDDNLMTATTLTSLPILDDRQKNSPPEEQTSGSLNQTMTFTGGATPLTTERNNSTRCSQFYWACRNGDTEIVTQLLPILSQDEIDQIEPNGSTALHAAAYHGHTDIVRLLLERGADRSIKNKFDCVPFDEAANEGVKELFLRTPNTNRLNIETGKTEWETIAHDALEVALHERELIRFTYTASSQERMFEKIEKNYIKQGLANCSRINQITHFFEKATRNQDPIWIIKAYTAETDFYNVLNAELAGGAGRYQAERRFIIALLMHHPQFDNLSYVGTSYRVMMVTEHDLEKYKINSLLSTKSFLSSTINEKIAIGFLSRQEIENARRGLNSRTDTRGRIIKSWIMFKYHIKHRRTALHIENSSQYVAEAEVLIMPYTVFKIKSKRLYDIKDISQHERIWMFEFEECDESNNN